MANHQRGASTRVLFDCLLGLEETKPSEIPDYDHEVTTHLAAALVAKSKGVDFTVGVESAAIKMGLDFVHLQDEDYGFVLKRESLKLEPTQELVQMSESQVFRDAVDTLRGYTASQSDHVRYYEG